MGHSAHPSGGGGRRGARLAGRCAGAAALALLAAPGCAARPIGGAPEGSPGTPAAAGAAGAASRVACDAGNGGISLPRGFCAVVVVDSIGRARHLAVASNGDVFVRTNNVRANLQTGQPEVRGGVLALRDTTGDGKADVVERFGDNGGTGIVLRGDALYASTDDAVLRYRLPAGRLRPSGPPDTIVSGLPAYGGHRAKSIAVSQGSLFVNVGSPTNACQDQAQDRKAEAPGLDPCPQLETRAGIWRFDGNRTGQTQRDGERYATGLRNTVALTLGPDGALYGAVHGRDQLFQNYGSMFTAEQSAEQPSEELVRIRRGADYGWPYCYHDNAQGKKVLAPEYGGDGRRADRCADKALPLVAFPGHWAPNALRFYDGALFPARYRGGAFIAFHGSWNRAPLPQAGYNVVFVPFANGEPSGRSEVFADGFAGPTPPAQSNQARARPTGLAVGPDGSLYIADGQRGKIWRVVWRR